MQGLGCGIPWAKQSGGGGAAAWTPADATPLFWIDVPVARAAGRLFTTSAKTTAATALSDPVGAIVQEGSLGNDLTQATTSRRYYLDQMADGQWAVAGDNVDDALTNSSIAFATGAKTIGLRCEYHTALGASELDTLLFVGGASATTRINVGSSGYTSPGIFFACDEASGTASIRYPSFIPTLGTAFTLVLAYNGGAINLKASYRLFLDGVEVTLPAVSSPTIAGAAVNTILCRDVANAPAGAKMSKVFVLSGDQSALIAEMQAYLVAP